MHSCLKIWVHGESCDINGFYHWSSVSKLFRIRTLSSLLYWIYWSCSLNIIKNIHYVLKEISNKSDGLCSSYCTFNVRSMERWIGKRNPISSINSFLFKIFCRVGFSIQLWWYEILTNFVFPNEFIQPVECLKMKTSIIITSNHPKTGVNVLALLNRF